MSRYGPDGKKRLEKHYTEEARRAYPLFPKGELISHERPDFLLRLHDETIGIEVTQLCREGPRAEAGRLGKIPAKAKARYSRLAGAEPVNVSLAFSRHAANVSFERLTNSLVEFVYARRKTRGIGRVRDLPEGYCHIGIHAPFEELDPTGHWHGVRSFDTVVAPKQLLDFRIAEKNARLAEYRFAVPEVWLLIVNDQFLGPGEVCVRPEDLAEWKFSFDFEKVLLFAREPSGGGTVFELQRAASLSRPILTASAMRNSSVSVGTTIVERREAHASHG
jgi:hypothetical protein